MAKRKKINPEEFDLWCLTCGVGFYSCSVEVAEHYANPNNTGHSMYDGDHIDDKGNAIQGTSPLYFINQPKCGGAYQAEPAG